MKVGAWRRGILARLMLAGLTLLIVLAAPPVLGPPRSAVGAAEPAPTVPYWHILGTWQYGDRTGANGAMSYDTQTASGALTGDCAGPLTGSIVGNTVTWRDSTGGRFAGTVNDTGTLIAGTYTPATGDRFAAWMTGQALSIKPAPTSPAARFTPDQKAKLTSLAYSVNTKSNASGYIGAACGGLALIPALTLPGGVCATIGGLMWASGAELANQLFKLAGDPPDANFTSVYQPIVHSLPGQPFAATGGLTKAEADAMNAYYANQTRAIAVAIALRVSIERAQGADLAGDALWKGRHVAAAQSYAAELNTLLGQEPTLAANLANVVLANRPALRQIKVAKTDIAAFDRDVQANGLPAAVRDALTALGVDATTQDELKLITTTQDLNGVATLIGSSPLGYLTSASAATATQGVASSMNQYATTARCVPVATTGTPTPLIDRGHRLLVPLVISSCLP